MDDENNMNLNSKQLEDPFKDQLQLLDSISQLSPYTFI